MPLEQNDGDYVYIQAGGESVRRLARDKGGGGGGGGSSSSRDDVSTAGSTLPMSAAAQNRLSNNARNSAQSQQFEPESPGRNSNYVNIDYFISQNRSDETRSSSIDSDGENNEHVLLRTVSQDDATIIQPNTPGSFRKLPVSDIILI